MAILLKFNSIRCRFDGKRGVASRALWDECTTKFVSIFRCWMPACHQRNQAAIVFSERHASLASGNVHEAARCPTTQTTLTSEAT